MKNEHPVLQLMPIVCASLVIPVLDVKLSISDVLQMVFLMMFMVVQTAGI